MIPPLHSKRGGHSSTLATHRPNGRPKWVAIPSLGGQRVGLGHWEFITSSAPAWSFWFCCNLSPSTVSLVTDNRGPFTSLLPSSSLSPFSVSSPPPVYQFSPILFPPGNCLAESSLPIPNQFILVTLHSATQHGKNSGSAGWCRG